MVGIYEFLLFFLFCILLLLRFLFLYTIPQTLTAHFNLVQALDDARGAEGGSSFGTVSFLMVGISFFFLFLFSHAIRIPLYSFVYTYTPFFVLGTRRRARCRGRFFVRHSLFLHDLAYALFFFFFFFFFYFFFLFDSHSYLRFLRH